MIVRYIKMRQGQRVDVKLTGTGEERNWYPGKVIKAKKMWVELDDYHGDKFIADENNIKEWRPAKPMRRRESHSSPQEKK